MHRLTLLIPALAALGCATTPSAVPLQTGSQLTGTWRGAIALPNGALQFIARVAEDGSGSVDVPQQGAKDLPLRVVRSEGNAFEWVTEIPGADAVLTGTREGDELRGTFSQRGLSFPFELKRDGSQGVASAPPPPTGVVRGGLLAGAWHGAVVVGAQQLPFEIAFDDAGTSGTFTVPSQGLRGLELEELAFDGSRVAFRVSLPNGQAGAFDGTLKGARVEGTYAQGGGKSTFFMDRGERVAEKPAPSKTHEEHEVTFTHGDVTLAGVLTLPRDVPRPAVAVLVSGSGPQDRNEEVAGFKVFEALAHALAKGGVATLRYDDRGIGRSTGDFHASTTADFALDADAAVRFLRTRADVDTKRIGIVGHSEGAVVAPMVAVRNRDLAFLVLLAPPAQNLGDLVVDQIEPVGRAEGSPIEAIEASRKMMRKVVALLRDGKDLSSIEADLTATCAPACKAGDATITAMRRQLETPWFRAFVALDPAPFLSKVTVPVLAISGGLDVQVPGDKNLPLLRKISAHKKGTFVIEEIEGMNHLLQQAKTGAVSEYAKLAKTLEPKVPARILAWMGQAVPAR